MNKRIRQYLGILAAVFTYYLIHEGAHLLMALHYGVFRQVNFLGLGMQIDIFADRLTDFQLGIFCLAGAAATALSGWALILLTGKICKAKSKVFRAVMWYISLTLLLLDPLYLSILCGFFGGGDMNGIALLIPEAGARIVFGILGIVQGIVIWKYLLPQYTKSFQEGHNHDH